MGRVVGGGFRVGNSCTPMVDSCQCRAKQIEYCKVKKKKRRSIELHFKTFFESKRITSLCSIQDTRYLGLVHGDDPKR